MILPLGVAGTIWGILRLREPVAFPLIGAAYVYALFVLAVLSLAAFSLRGRHDLQPVHSFAGEAARV
jgi:hypothetical protein